MPVWTHRLLLDEGRVEGEREVDEVALEGAVLDCCLFRHGGLQTAA